jgi:nitroimidazol reductase NimA-like FMN-containing flavoprotein (pyridoxamine 5'-phosphate oxidase superfamily)
MHYWLATTRPDGRPHVVPLDGLWLDDAWFFGGSAETVKSRNLKANPRAVVHLDDSERAVIVEGRCEDSRSPVYERIVGEPEKSERGGN